MNKIPRHQERLHAKLKRCETKYMAHITLLEDDLEVAHETLADFTNMARELKAERDTLHLVLSILTRNQTGMESIGRDTGTRLVQASNSRKPMEAGQV